MSLSLALSKISQFPFSSFSFLFETSAVNRESDKSSSALCSWSNPSARFLPKISSEISRASNIIITRVRGREKKSKEGQGWLWADARDVASLVNVNIQKILNVFPGSSSSCLFLAPHFISWYNIEAIDIIFPLFFLIRYKFSDSIVTRFRVRS